MSIKKSTLGGLMIVDNDSDRVTFEPACGESNKITIQGYSLVVAERSDIEELVQYLTGWLEETPIPDGWYAVKWRNNDRGVFAIRVYGGVHYGVYGGKIDPNEITHIRRLGDLTPEDISTLKKEDV